MPQPLPNALGGQQVGLTVQARQQPPVFGDGVAVGVEVAALGQQPANAVERARQRVGRGRDLALELLGLGLQPEVALHPPQVGLPVGRPVHRVGAQLPPELSQLRVGMGVGTPLLPPGRAQAQVAQRRGDVAAGLG